MSATIDLLGVLHEAVAKELLDRIRSGEASAADISNAIKMLKDNGIEARPDKNAALQSLASQFPIFDDEHETRQ
jgi:hypothetical protein